MSSNNAKTGRFPVKYDQETGELYYEKETTTGMQEKIVIKQADLEITKDQQKTVKTSGGIKIDEKGVGLNFSKESHWQETLTYSRKGGKVEIPITENCLLDTDCRESILGAVNNAIAGDGQNALQRIN